MSATFFFCSLFFNSGLSLYFPAFRTVSLPWVVPCTGWNGVWTKGVVVFEYLIGHWASGQENHYQWTLWAQAMIHPHVTWVTGPINHSISRFLAPHYVEYACYVPSIVLGTGGTWEVWDGTSAFWSLNYDFCCNLSIHIFTVCRQGYPACFWSIS